MSVFETWDSSCTGPLLRLDRLVAHQGFHNKGVNLLAFAFPVIAHALRLFLVRHGDVKADQDVFPLPHLTVNGVILIGGFIEIRDKRYNGTTK